MGKNKRKPRLFVLREPSGRMTRSGNETEPAPVAVKRLRDAALRGTADQRWATELGRLYLDGRINEAMLLAGERWASIVRDYLEAIGAPADMRSGALERGSIASPPDPDSERGQLMARRDRAAVRAMQEAHAVLCAAGKLAERAVRATCERNESVAGFDLVNLVRGLGFLNELWNGR